MKVWRIFGEIITALCLLGFLYYTFFDGDMKQIVIFGFLMLGNMIIDFYRDINERFNNIK